MVEKVSLSAPWVTYYKKILELFRYDPNVKVAFDYEEMKLFIRVQGDAKAEAIAQLLPQQVEFGNIILTINIIPANENNCNGKKLVNKSDSVLFADAFAGNEAVNNIFTVEGIFNAPFTYVVFKNQVVQFFNDDLSDPHGNCSTLYQEIAKEIFKDRVNYGVFFCTDLPEVKKVLGAPLGEWP